MKLKTTGKPGERCWYTIGDSDTKFGIVRPFKYLDTLRYVAWVADLFQVSRKDDYTEFSTFDDAEQWLLAQFEKWAEKATK